MTELKVGTPVQTRDGRAARIVAELNGGKQLLVIVTERDGEEWPVRYSSDGRAYVAHETSYDLIRKLRQRDVWLVLGREFFNAGGIFGVYGSKENAMAAGGSVVRVTVTEDRMEIGS